MAADTDDGVIGEDCQADVIRMRNFFPPPSPSDNGPSDNIPSNKQVKITYLTSAPVPKVPPPPPGFNFSHDAILKHYTALRQDSDFNPKTDTILFYYSGHGFHDREKGHFLRTPGKVLLRTELREAVLNCQPRLAVIITDCCQQVKALPTVNLFGASAASEIVDALFFKPVGFIDINSCSQGQLAGGGAPKAGGFFTKALFDLMASPIEDFDLNNDNVLTWREFFPLLMGETTENWKNGCDRENPPGCTKNRNLPGGLQCTQNPQAYSLPARTPIDPPEFKHGLTIAVLQKDGKDAGLNVTAVQPGSPAEQAGLKKDDVILEIDNKRILNPMEFDCAINFPPGCGSIRVKYDRASKIAETKISLPVFKHGLTVAVFQKDGKDAGLKVSAVQPGSPAEKAGLKKDDVIVKIKNKSIVKPMEFECATDFAIGSIRVTYRPAGASDGDVDKNIILEHDN